MVFLALSLTLLPSPRDLSRFVHLFIHVCLCLYLSISRIVSLCLFEWICLTLCFRLILKAHLNSCTSKPLFHVFVFLFHSFYMRPRISIRGSIRPSIGPSVRPLVQPSVRYASAKTAFLGCFWPRWDPTLKQMINQPTCPSNCLSIYVTWSIHAETRPGRIVARSGLFVNYSTQVKIVTGSVDIISVIESFFGSS